MRIDKTNVELVNKMSNEVEEIRKGLIQYIDDEIMFVIRHEIRNKWLVIVDSINEKDEPTMFAKFVERLYEMDRQLGTDNVILKGVYEDIAKTYTEVGLNTEILRRDNKLQVVIRFKDGISIEDFNIHSGSGLNFRKMEEAMKKADIRIEKDKVIGSTNLAIVNTIAHGNHEVKVKNDNDKVVKEVVNHYNEIGIKANKTEEGFEIRL